MVAFFEKVFVYPWNYYNFAPPKLNRHEEDIPAIGEKTQE